jgi:hypothetical protein
LRFSFVFLPFQGSYLRLAAASSPAPKSTGKTKARHWKAGARGAAALKQWRAGLFSAALIQLSMNCQSFDSPYSLSIQPTINFSARRSIIMNRRSRSSVITRPTFSST